MAIANSLTPDQLKKLMNVQWDAGLTMMNPTPAARMVAIGDDGYLDATAYGDVMRRMVPIKRKRGAEIEDGIFVERQELMRSDGLARCIRYRIDLSEWEGDREDIFIPNAGRCAQEAGIDTIMSREIRWDDRVMRPSQSPVDDEEMHALKSAVHGAKYQLTDKLLDVMGTTRSEVMEEHYKSLSWIDYRNGFVIPAGHESVDWLAAGRAKQEDLNREERMVLAIQQAVKENAELTKIASEIAEAEAIEGHTIYGAWG